MERTKFEFDPETETVIVADLVAKDARKRIFLLVQTESNQGLVGWGIKNLIYKLKWSEVFIPFTMLVEPDKMQIFKWNGSELSEPVFVKNTADVLKYYGDRLGEKRIFKDYLTGLTELWLHDLETHWKTQNTPGETKLA